MASEPHPYPHPGQAEHDALMVLRMAHRKYGRATDAVHAAAQEFRGAIAAAVLAGAPKRKVAKAAGLSILEVSRIARAVNRR